MKQRVHRCSRCAYEVASFSIATCPECGWGMAHAAPCRQFFEVATEGFVRPFIRTFVCSLVSARFWRRIARFRAGSGARLAAFAGACIALMCFAVGLALLAHYAAYHVFWPRPPLEWIPLAALDRPITAFGLLASGWAVISLACVTAGTLRGVRPVGMIPCALYTLPALVAVATLRNIYEAARAMEHARPGYDDSIEIFVGLLGLTAGNTKVLSVVLAVWLCWAWIVCFKELDQAASH